MFWCPPFIFIHPTPSLPNAAECFPGRVSIRGNFNFYTRRLSTPFGICFPRLPPHGPVSSLKFSFQLQKPGETKVPGCADIEALVWGSSRNELELSPRQRHFLVFLLQRSAGLPSRRRGRGLGTHTSLPFCPFARTSLTVQHEF